MQLQRLLVGVFVALGTPAFAQDSSSGQTPNYVGSARVAIAALFERLDDYYDPLQTDFSGRATYAPFVTKYLQLGVAPSLTSSSGAGGRYRAGGATLTANVIPFGRNSTLMYLGISASDTIGGYRTTRAIGAQAGVLRFLSPSIGLRAEFRDWHYPNRLQISDLMLSMEPYLFGPADRPLNELPGLGVVDATLFADYQFHPLRDLVVDATAAAFLNRWLQIGAKANLNFQLYNTDGDHYLELFGRGYLPLSARVLPFGEIFASREFASFLAAPFSNDGARAGVRTYLAPGVALDVALQWRHYGPQTYADGVAFYFPEQRSVRVQLTTQFRVAHSS